MKKHYHNIFYTMSNIIVRLSVFTLLLVGIFTYMPSAAYAWQCSITANTVATENGTQATLRWQSPSDVSYVTIDALPGKRFPASGTETLMIYDVTTITAYTHVDGSDDTLSCTVTVSPISPPTTNSCQDVSLDISAYSFEWSGAPEMDTYHITYCDGTEAYECDECGLSQIVTTDKEIQSVVAQGENCTLEKTRTCTPAPKAPERPYCPFVADTTTTVISFNKDEKLFSNRGKDYAETDRYAVNLSKGTYLVRAASWDGYIGRETVTQPRESWYVKLVKDATEIARTHATTDLEDNVLEAFAQDTLDTALTLTDDVNGVFAFHAAYPDTTSYNSVVPICVAFTKQTVTPPAPTCTITPQHATIQKGESVTIAWESHNATKVQFTGIATTTLSGTVAVTPTDSVVYTAVFANDNNDEVTCTSSITVIPPESEAPSCSMSITPNNVRVGETATLSWYSTKAKTARITPNVGIVQTSGSKKVVVRSNTTYVGTFTGTDGETASCSAQVRVNKGPGGSCLNCDTKKNVDEKSEKKQHETSTTTPHITLTKSISKGSVSLAAVPYTGFEAGPLLTTLFWITVFLVSAGIAHVITKYRARQEKVASALTDTGPVSVEYNLLPEEYDEGDGYVTQTPHSEPSIAQHTLLAQSDGDGDEQDIPVMSVEEEAHKEHILLSPEAERAIATIVDQEEDARAFVRTLFEKAKSLYPKEDGWILLSKDRMNLLIKKVKEERSQETDTSAGQTQEVNNRGADMEYKDPQFEHRVTPEKLGDVTMHTDEPEAHGRITPVSVQHISSTQDKSVTSAPLASSTQTSGEGKRRNEGAKNSVHMFVDTLVKKDQKRAYELLRAINARGIEATTLFSAVVRELDNVYRNRIEGNHAPDQMLAQKTASWSNKDFETVLGILVECIDYGYSNNRIGAKIALAKLFDYLNNTTQK